MSSKTSSPQNNSFDTEDISSPRSNDESTVDSLDSLFEANQKTENKPKALSKCNFSRRSQIFWRIFVALFGVLVMFTARVNVPNNPVGCVEDRLMNAFQSLNDWIHVHDNSFYRAALLFACGTQIDLIFFATLAYWICYGRTGRLPISLAIFYGIRAIVQMMWWSPFPAGYYWDTPGFPSFVAPYGKMTDFFFSGHSGFLVLMANEWNAMGKKKMRNYCLINLVYTVFILLVYQAHYSIDIFTGVFFADYVFDKVNAHKERIDGYFKTFAKNTETLTNVVRSKVVGPAVSSLKKRA